MIERGGSAGLALETLDRGRVSAKRPIQHLDGHLTVQPRVVRQVDVGHPARADPANQSVTLGNNLLM